MSGEIFIFFTSRVKLKPYFHLQIGGSKCDSMQSLTHSSGTCLQNFIDFGLEMGMLCMNLYSNPVG